MMYAVAGIDGRAEAVGDFYGYFAEMIWRRKIWIHLRFL